MKKDYVLLVNYTNGEILEIPKNIEYEITIEEYQKGLEENVSLTLSRDYIDNTIVYCIHNPNKKIFSKIEFENDIINYLMRRENY